MTGLEATITRTGRLLNVKVYDDVVVHHFIVHPDAVEYEVRKRHSELVCLASGELEDLQEDDHVRRLVLGTGSHTFEILPAANNNFKAYKAVKK